MFHHPTKDVWTLVHGDDYCSAGTPEALDWLEDALIKRYAIKTQRISEGKSRSGEEKLREGQVLNRVVRLTEQGWELEADPRHVELIVKHLGLESANCVNTPGVNVIENCAADIEEEDEDVLPPDRATQYRAIGARCNYLQPDRPDIQYATKEVCRRMCKPIEKSWEMLKRIGRYLKGRPRLIWKYGWQSPQDVIDVHCDANWAGCRKSRKSSSGGTVQIGSHLIDIF